MIFGGGKKPEGEIKRREPHTQLIRGVHPAHTRWRLLRWLLFLSALLSIVCGGFLLSVRSTEMKYECQTLAVDSEEAKRIVSEHAKSTAAEVARAFREYWILLVIILAGVFTFFELFIHSRWKIYVIYALMAIAAWIFVLYSLNLMELPIEELRKAGGGG